MNQSKSKRSLSFIGCHLQVIGELFATLWRRGLWWMMPLAAVLILLSLLLVAIASTGPLAPFVYPLL